LSVDRRQINLQVDEQELNRRRAQQPPAAPLPRRGYERLYLRSIQQAHLGADFDFLRHESLQEKEQHG